VTAAARETGASSDDVRDVGEFNVAALWRYEAIMQLGLTGDSLAVAASPSPVFPQMLRFLTRNLDGAPDGPVVDVGAGLAGIAEMVRRALQRPVVAFDASCGACAGARRLFPEVLAAGAHPSALPIHERAVPAAISCGLLSVLADRDSMIAEVRRVIKDGGRFLVIDPASASSTPLRIGSRNFQSAEGIVGSLDDAGFDVTDAAVGLTSLSDWALADGDIAREVARQRRGDSEYDHWLDDRRRFERVMSSERVVMVGFSAEPR